ncbi:MAG: hypothetical protein JW839_16790 [Candidatus Lokiarchaeota archaeon]|nr:hypothetical protein [Candidatus Lokiarchaeota archaeon]
MSDTNAQGDPLRPVHARSVIQISHRGDGVVDFSQVLEYDYEDISGTNVYHRRVSSDPRFVKEELSVLERNMQSFLDDETNVVNGERVFPRVLTAFIAFRGGPSHPVCTWLVAWSADVGLGGTYVYEARVEAATLEYGVESIYTLPLNARVVGIESSLPYDNAIKNVIVFRGAKGDKVGEVERLSWIIEQ